MPLVAPLLKHLRAYWSCAGMKGLSRRPPSQNQTEGVKAPTQDICAISTFGVGSSCATQSSCTSQCGKYQVPDPASKTLETGTWNYPSFKDFTPSQTLSTSQLVWLFQAVYCLNRQEKVHLRCLLSRSVPAVLWETDGTETERRLYLGRVVCSEIPQHVMKPKSCCISVFSVSFLHL